MQHNLNFRQEERQVVTCVAGEEGSMEVFSFIVSRSRIDQGMRQMFQVALRGGTRFGENDALQLSQLLLKKFGLQLDFKAMCRLNHAYQTVVNELLMEQHLAASAAVNATFKTTAANERATDSDQQRSED